MTSFPENCMKGAQAQGHGLITLEHSQHFLFISSIQYPLFETLVKPPSILNIIIIFIIFIIFFCPGVFKSHSRDYLLNPEVVSPGLSLLWWLVSGVVVSDLSQKATRQGRDFEEPVTFLKKRLVGGKRLLKACGASARGGGLLYPLVRCRVLCCNDIVSSPPSPLQCRSSYMSIREQAPCPQS